MNYGPHVWDGWPWHRPGDLDLTPWSLFGQCHWWGHEHLWWPHIVSCGSLTCCGDTTHHGPDPATRTHSIRSKIDFQPQSVSQSVRQRAWAVTERLSEVSELRMRWTNGWLISEWRLCWPRPGSTSVLSLHSHTTIIITLLWLGLRQQHKIFSIHKQNTFLTL